MSDKNPCPICGDESEYLRFLDSCAERANEKWRENEVRILTDVYKSMDFVQVVRCRDCVKANWVAAIGHGGFTCRVHGWTSDSVDGFCSWGERRITCKCGEEMESEGKCPSCGRWVHDDQA